MKRLLSILFLLSVFACTRQEITPVTPPVDPESGSEILPDIQVQTGGLYRVFPPSGNIPEVHIKITEENWSKLLGYFDHDKNTRQYISCDISYRDGSAQEAVQGAGLRLKGNTSRRRPEKDGRLRHVHFSIHLSEYTQGAELLEESRFDLKWFKDDPSYSREVFCYDLFRRCGVWTAISSGYTRLWVQIGSRPETYYGVYELMEHVKGDYLKHRAGLFGDRDGNLWKARWGASMKDPNGNMGADDNKHDYTYELKSNKTEFAAAKTQLQNFIRSLNNLSGEKFYAWAQNAMDVRLILRTYAVNVAVGMWDDYWVSANNYYFYFNSAGKFFFIPYDYDNTLGTSLYIDSGRQDPLNWGSPDNPLIAKLLGKSEWKEYYVACLKAIVKEKMQADASISLIKSWHYVISPYVPNDTGEDMEIADRPASWGNHGEYRILSAGSDNYFSVKAESISEL